MNLYAFEIVQTVDDMPDPCAYPEGLSHTPRYSGSAKVVYFAFEDEAAAKAQAVTHEEGYKSQVWEKCCPSRFKFSDSIGGLDVFYIGPLSDEEAEEAHQSYLRVLYHHPSVSRAAFSMLTHDKQSSPPTPPTERERNLFYHWVEDRVAEYLSLLDVSTQEALKE